MDTVSNHGVPPSASPSTINQASAHYKGAAKCVQSDGITQMRLLTAYAQNVANRQLMAKPRRGATIPLSCAKNVAMRPAMGLVKSEAAELRRSGQLSEDIKAAWDQYDAIQE